MWNLISKVSEVVTQPAPVRAAKPLYSNVSPVVPSPCTSVCRLDEQKVCLGCFRHVEDIREWRSADDERRRVICAEAAHRKATSHP
ncbi:hypothetical protein PS723_06404 [Pseudomonas fluorescens]|uniref:DUF1289 domain-containing protein n=1 Tax=Pseudomonas fluorescens TaxID=294 RepID=A0A5E7FY30_PSEFL|nr:hypothetical protein PS723_02252 [Pseudomonas fluorescens]VVO44651.1 hypothetical protein PS723_06404 [Pseudomonas fluorescens]